MYRIYFYIITLLTFLSISNAFGQACPTIKKRTYATRQEISRTTLLNLGSVINPENAIQQDNIYDYSRLSIAASALGLIYSRQLLEFRDATNTAARTISANTPVTIKLGLPVSLLGVLNSITIQPFNNLTSGGTATAAGSASTLSSVVSLISGKGEVEITINPTANYQGVWIDLRSTLGVALTTDIYYAYIEEDDTSSPIDCNQPIEVLSGVRAATGLAIANATASVTNPLNAIDGNSTTATDITLGAQVLSIAYLKAIFRTPSVPGEQIDIILSNTGSVLQLGLLNSFTITPYLGATALTPLDNTSNFLQLQLLNSSAGVNTYRLTANISQSFDRVEISFGGVANVNLSAFKIHEIERKLPPPSPLINGSSISSPPVICAGNTATLTIPSPLNCTRYQWYEDAAATIPVTVTSPGTTFTTPVLSGNKTYYVKAVRNNACSNSSEVLAVPITVTPLPGFTLGLSPEICQGVNNANINITSTTNGASSYTINWSSGLTNIPYTALPSNNTISVNTTGLAPGTYNGTIKVRNSAGCESPTQNVTVKVDPKPATPNIPLTTNAKYIN